MSYTFATRTINAPADVVFRTVADINQYSKAIPHIVKVEFLSEKKSGIGTRFRETRLMKGKETSTELEVTKYVPNDHIRLVSDTHGTIWDSIFTAKPDNGKTLLTFTMDARAKKIIPKIMIFFIRHMVQKAVEEDMDWVKSFCEQNN
jgi:uncharacterized membrane protein